MKYASYFLLATSLEEELPRELESSNKHLGWKSEKKKKWDDLQETFQWKAY